MNACQGEEKRVWRNLYEMVQHLGRDGMSSDESDVDEHDRPVYYVRTCPYRSSRLQARLDIIDHEANHTNGYGNQPPGNPQRVRIRPAEPDESTRRPPVKLPKNFYDRRWLSALSPVLLGYLEPADDFQLISIDRGDRFAGGSRRRGGSGYFEGTGQEGGSRHGRTGGLGSGRAGASR